MRLLALGSFALGLLGCASSAQPRDGALPQEHEAAPAMDTRGDGAQADVRFAQGMIQHHAQALAMTSLVARRSSRSEVRLLAERLDVSQRDEIAQLRAWLSRRGESARDLAEDHDPAHSHAAMPGMRTPEQLARLRAARGAEFDRLFLEHMISHHEGALVMVRELFATPGAGQDPEVFRFASDIDADQRIEIARMQRMLAAIPADGQ